MQAFLNHLNHSSLEGEVTQSDEAISVISRSIVRHHLGVNHKNWPSFLLHSGSLWGIDVEPHCSTRRTPFTNWHFPDTTLALHVYVHSGFTSRIDKPRDEGKRGFIFHSTNYKALLLWRFSGIHRDIHSRDSRHDDDGGGSRGSRRGDNPHRRIHILHRIRGHLQEQWLLPPRRSLQVKIELMGNCALLNHGKGKGRDEITTNLKRKTQTTQTRATRKKAFIFCREN